MPKRLPKGKVGLYMYVSPETKDFLIEVVKTSREENGPYRSMGVFIECAVLAMVGEDTKDIHFEEFHKFIDRLEIVEDRG